ncbi:MAG: DUF3108 domain-containing protein [Brevinematales bacterium]|nr:DUF3108 domain-containing protein [Brevinematales bacterium]
MKQLFVVLFFVLFFLGSVDGQVKFLKYEFSVLGVKAGEATVRIRNTQTNVVVSSKIKTYSGVRLFVNVDDNVVSYIEPNTLRTLKREVISVGNSLRDTNITVFYRDRQDILIDSLLFGKIYIHNTNDSINDLATEIYKAMDLRSLPSEFSVNFLEVTNTRFITLSNQVGGRFLIKEIKGAYVEFTNINSLNIFSRASVPVFYLFPFGNISLYVELKEISF